MVYVDDGSLNYFQTMVFWMVADTEAELHAMALQVGLKRQVFPNSRVYLIDRATQEKALALGARLLPRAQLLKRDLL